MFDIKGLKLKIPGQFNDAYLYGDKLYLIDDEYFYILDFKKLINNIVPDDPEIRILCRYAFLNNDFFYKADSDFFDFFNMPTIKKFLLKQFESMQNLNLTKTTFKKFIIQRLKHSHIGAYHLEVYKNNIFISSDKGVFSYIFLNGKLLRESKLLDFPAYQISANYGNNVFFSCGEEGLNILNFDNLNRRNRLDISDSNKIENATISIDFAYSDIIVKDINSKYHYQLDKTLIDDDRQHISPRERIYLYEKLEDPFLEKVQVITASGNKLLKIKDNSIELFKIDYEVRKEHTSNMNIEDFYDSVFKWTMPRKINEVYDGFQTVFGYILDTDKGTLVIDDDSEEDNKIKAYILSKGENVKIRHFYRSINYSHLLLNIKNNFLDIYADLSDYFFIPSQKKIRRNITRRQAMRG